MPAFARGELLSLLFVVAEAQKVVSEGIASADEVDQLMMDCFRWPTGPFGMVKGAGSGWG